MVKLSEKKWDYEQNLFVGKYRGHTYIIKRMPLGHLCGYIRLTKRDKFFGVQYDDVETDLSVHGGVTYSSKHSPLNGSFNPNKKYYYIGFDTAHGGDVSPAMVEFLKHLPSYGTYKDLAYVRSQCKKLIKQLN